ncbi:MAG TPA: hypothetical protein VLH19_05290 [Patescibacteria group bacterium]|nr:hypothetical protein [Patescibacteria group bacterium]
MKNNKERITTDSENSGFYYSLFLLVKKLLSRIKPEDKLDPQWDRIARETMPKVLEEFRKGNRVSKS